MIRRSLALMSIAFGLVVAGLCSTARCQSLEGLRGVNVNQSISEADIDALHGWRANVIRYQFIPPADIADTDNRAEKEAEYVARVDEAMTHLDSLMPACARNNLRVLFEIHNPPGGEHPSVGSQPGGSRLFYEQWAQDALVRVWEHIASHYATNGTIVGYDILNEPRTPHFDARGNVIQSDINAWRSIANRVASAIRQHDSQHAIVFETPYARPSGFAHLQPLDGARVVYSFHMYEPTPYTHQWIPGFNHDHTRTYPGTVSGIQWNKQRLQHVMQPAIDFKRQHRKQMFAGEFSAARYAPGAALYLADLIDVFEDNGLSWAYHAWREAPVWDLEKVNADRTNANPPRAPRLTDRAHAVRSGLARNRP